MAVCCCVVKFGEHPCCHHFSSLITCVCDHCSLVNGFINLYLSIWHIKAGSLSLRLHQFQCDLYLCQSAVIKLKYCRYGVDYGDPGQNRSSIPFGTQLKTLFWRDHKNRSPVSQQVWHDKNTLCSTANMLQSFSGNSVVILCVKKFSAIH